MQAPEDKATDDTKMRGRFEEQLPEKEQQQDRERRTDTHYANRNGSKSYSSNTLPRGPYLRYKYGGSIGSGPNFTATTSTAFKDRGREYSAEQLLRGRKQQEPNVRQPNGTTKLSYSTISGANSISYHKQPPYQQVGPLVSHMELQSKGPPPLIRDNNNLRVNQYPMSMTGRSSTASVTMPRTSTNNYVMNSRHWPGYEEHRAAVDQFTYHSLPRTIPLTPMTSSRMASTHLNSLPRTAAAMGTSPIYASLGNLQNKLGLDGGSSILIANHPVTGGCNGSLITPPVFADGGPSIISHPQLTQSSHRATTTSASSTEERSNYLSGLRNSNNNLIRELKGANDKKNDFPANIRQSSSPSTGSLAMSMHPGVSAGVLKEHYQPPSSLRRPSSAFSYSSTTDVNCVGLDEVLRFYPDGVFEHEGWALLCQSVQALQDLFLADTPSVSRILPLVTPNSLQITSRGRVAFKIIPADQLVSVEMDFLSPEFLAAATDRNTVSQSNATFSESDIEKMWVYALGVTLRLALRPTYNITATTMHVIMEKQRKPVISQHQLLDDYYPANRRRGTRRDNSDGAINCNHLPSPQGSVGRGSVMAGDKIALPSSLEFVINSMCHVNLELRASLMNLLDIISDHCRTHHQVKPFSHVVMDLFQNTANYREVDRDEDEEDVHKLRLKTPKEEKSDTDSGRSSGQGSDHQLNRHPFPPLPSRASGSSLRKLEVHRMPTIKSAENTPTKQKPYTQPPVQAVGNHNNALQVMRRKRRRETFRRNTIDVNKFELADAQRRIQFPAPNMDLMNVSKSTNFIDKVLMEERNEFNRKIGQMTFSGGNSLPDLCTEKIISSAEPTLALTVKRTMDVVPSLKIRKCVSTDDFLMQVNCNRRPEFTGADFIIKPLMPPKQIDLCGNTGSDKNVRKRFINILLLNGHTIQVRCNAMTVICRQILEAVFRSEDFVENYFLGLCIIIGGDFVFLPTDLKLHKVAPGWSVAMLTKEVKVPLSLFVRVKFYLPTLRGLNSRCSRHLLYLQLRKSILEKQILCSEDDLILLGGLALQAEVGDFQENMKHVDYFTICHYLPEGVTQQRNRELAKYLRNSHYVKRGLHPLEAEHNFIRYVQELKEFGQHLYSAVWSMDDGTEQDVFLAISISGICLFQRNSAEEDAGQRPAHLMPGISLPSDSGYPHDSRLAFRRNLYTKFEWLEIENLCYSKHVLCIVVRNRETLVGKDNNRVKYKLRMDGRKSYLAFSLASDHHKFYLKLRNSFVSLREISNEFNIDIGQPSRDSEKSMENSESASNSQNRKDGAAAASPESSGCSYSDQEKALAPPVGQLKKSSMLHDNKLAKLRQKLLKRSKSITVLSQHLVEDEVAANRGVDNFKENLVPETFSQSASPATMRHNFNNNYNRNKVKMGTRVFSSQQCLNRSYDNLNESAFKEEAYNSFSSSIVSAAGGFHDLSFQPIDEIDSENDEAKVVCNPQGPKQLERRDVLAERKAAYVLHGSILSSNSERTTISTGGCAQEETISDSLLEKFNNLSTATGDRIIRTLYIRKDVVVDARKEAGVARTEQPKSAFERFKILSSNRFSKRFMRKKNKALEVRDINATGGEEKKFSLGISIVQGPDGNIYVKELTPNGAAMCHGIRVGDQILAANNKPLIGIRYEEAVQVLQSNERDVQLIVAQVVTNSSGTAGISQKMMHYCQSEEDFSSLNFPAIKDDLEEDNMIGYFDQLKHEQERKVAEKKKSTRGGQSVLSRVLSPNNKSLSISKSAPDLPQVVATIPKRVALPKGVGLGRQFTGHVRYPVTPGKDPMTMCKSLTRLPNRKQLSLPVNESEVI